jgi:hypothetical protein
MKIGETTRLDSVTIEGMKIRLSGFSQASSRYVPTVTAINDELKDKWHFASDHRILLKDFNQFGVNLLLPESSLVSVKGPDELVIRDDIPLPS